MRDIVSLLVMIVVGVPVTLFLAGPLLVLSALKGRQRLGPIVFDPARQGRLGRVLALGFGLMLWLIVWGGLILLAGHLLRPLFRTTAQTQVAVSPTLAAQASPAGSQATVVSQPTQVPIISASPSPILPEPTTTPVNIVPASTQVAPPTATPSLPSATPVATEPPLPAPATDTPAPVTTTPVAPAPTPTQIGIQLSPTPTEIVPVSPEHAAQSIATVETANELLRLAVLQPNAENLAALEKVWKGDALKKAQDFAKGPSYLVGSPLEVTYAHLVPVTVSKGFQPDTLFVTAIEVWTYKGSESHLTEQFEFFYTLMQQDGQWVIVDYAYIDVPPQQLSPTNEHPESKSPIV